MVIGDLILDEYLFGTVDRISPEAPVPVVWVRNDKHTLGGSGNVIQNLSSIETKSIVMGRLGKDKAGDLMKSLILKGNVSEKDLRLLESETIPTILKTRIIASQQQVCRVDREEIVPLTPDEENFVLEQFKSKIGECSAVIVSDYDKGYLTKKVIEEVIRIAVENKVIVTVDPQISHFFLYNGIDIMTPNHHEAGKALGKKLETEKDIEAACIEISERIRPKAMMITRGDKGMTIYETDTKKFHHIPTVAKEVFDVTGAGDTVISTYTAFLAAGMSIHEASLISNASAGVVVGKLGAATVTHKEIEDNLKQLGLLEEAK
ncbi:D-glycero-beta-D-manno-heptose-7-phosphate kinase [Leptospira idonii]|uniref:D-glycero-beta-D-manno-heptose-7-phosphate kinase n=2 Tax=Leptospira idonii TaxID=1193500 RepID=A0A4R9LZ91_9LEPT|nr:D-glycero-beta-D-manno-heptose-7-phosphate kinase [Leptospira idonii]